MSLVPTYDFPVRLTADEMAALQTWKDRHGVSSRSKAMRLLAMIGLNFSRVSSSPKKDDPAQVCLSLSLPDDLYRHLQEQSERTDISIRKLIIDQLRIASSDATTMRLE